MLMLIPHICMVQNSSVLLSLFSLTQQCMLFYIMKIAFSFSESCSSLFWRITLLYSKGCFLYSWRVALFILKGCLLYSWRINLLYSKGCFLCFEKCSFYSERLLFLLCHVDKVRYVLRSFTYVLQRRTTGVDAPHL